MVGLAGPDRAVAADEDEILKAIKAMKAYLLKKQNLDGGHWENAYSHSVQGGGETALVTLALLLANEPMQHPRIDQALRYLDGRRMQGTYAIGLRASVWAQLPDDYRPELIRDMEWLLNAHDGQGRYSYVQKPQRFDHSATQYGVLGLWEAAKRGGRVPERLWAQMMNHFIDAQNPDGGWGYKPGHHSTGSMTAAGLTVLLVTQQQLFREKMLPPKELSTAIDEGIAWMDEHFTPETNPGSGSHLFYYLYSVERVALASGMRQFNGQDWFAAGADVILRQQRSDGSINSNTIDTSFALMFLSRGYRPVWVNKLATTGATWNNRPNDLHYLTRYLSELTETEMNWQVVRSTESVEAWLTAPVLYIASDRSIGWDPQQQAKLREYVLRGGTIFVNPDLGSSQLPATMRLWAATMFPEYEVRQLPDDHWIYTGLQQVPSPPLVPMYGLSNGVREMMIISDRDLGFRYQSGDSVGRDPSWKVAANLWAHVTNRGLLPARNASMNQPADLPESDAVLTIGRARYDGNWSPEPMAWDQIKKQIRDRGGVSIDVAPVSLDELSKFGGRLLHLAGVEPADLTAAQLLSIDRYVQEGGTVLVETVGGDGEFALDVERQFFDVYGQAAVPLSTDHPLISGEGYIGGYNATFSPFRRYTVLRRSTPPWPHLAAFFVDDRPAIIFSRDDLSLGMLGVRHWGIHGHEPTAARKLVTNLVLWIVSQQPTQPDAAADPSG